MRGNGISDALPGLFYFGAFALGFIFAVAVIAVLSLSLTVNIGAAFFAAFGVGACAALLVRVLI